MRTNRLFLTIALIIVLVISFIGGYVVAELYNKNNNIEDQKTSAKATRFRPNEDLISSNTKIMIKKNYSQNGIIYTEELEEKPDSSVLGMDKAATEKYYKNQGYNLIQFNNYRIILSKDITAWPPGRFLLKNNNGVLAVYEINDKSELNLKENTEISVDTLPEEDRDELNIGKIFDSLDEVYLIIEEYSS